MDRLFVLFAATLGVFTSTTSFTLGQFATVVDAPPTEIPPYSTFGSNTQVNLRDGSYVGGYTYLGDPDGSSVENSQLNVLGGAAKTLWAFSGSDLNIFSGSVQTAGLSGAKGLMAGGTVNRWSLYASSRLSFSEGFAGFVETGGCGSSDCPDASLLLVSGGQIGLLDATGNVVIDGGTIGDDFVFRGGGYVDIREGAIGNNFQIGATVIGAVPNSDESLVVGGGGRVSISGGSIGDNMVLYGGRSLTFSGGAIGQGFQAMDGSQVSILGSQFFVDSLELANPGPGESIDITERNVAITGLLADGNEFHFELYDETGKGDYFSAAASVSVMFVSEPKTAALAMLLLVPLIAAWRRQLWQRVGRHSNCAQ